MNLTKKVLRYWNKQDSLGSIGKTINKWPKLFEKYKNKPDWFYEQVFTPEMLNDIINYHHIEIEELFDSWLEFSEPYDLKIDSITINNWLLYHFYHDTNAKKIKRIHGDSWFHYETLDDIKNYFVQCEIK